MQSRVLVFVCVLLTQVAVAAESPQAIVDHMRSVYTDMASYSDTGTVVHEISPTSRDVHHFTTLFSRTPRHLLVDMHKQNDDRLIIWADPDAFHVWWKTTQQTTDYPNPKNTGAITLSDFPTNGAITKIPVLLYSRANMSGALTNFQPDGSPTTESVMGHPCFRLNGKSSDQYAQSGKQVNERKVTVWIDTKSYLLRQILEDPPAAPGMLNRTTTTFDPTANPTIPPDQFKFTPPK